MRVKDGRSQRLGGTRVDTAFWVQQLWAPMNSEQLWSPGQDQAGQHSSMERRDNKQERGHRIGTLNIV